MREDHANLEQATRLLYFLLEAGSPCRLIIDGFDELEEDSQKNLFRAIERLGQKCLFLISSRDQGVIRQSLERISTSDLGSLLEIQVARSDTEDDIKRYISSRFDSLGWHQEDSKQIKSELTTKSQGMFQYASVMIQNLSNYPPDTRLQALQEMPSNLAGVYDRIIHRMNDTHDHMREIVKRAILWILWVGRDLRSTELVVAFSISKAHVDDSETKFEERREYYITRLREICGGILEFRDWDGVITLSHHSVREYLLSDLCPISVFRERARAHNKIAQACLTFLNSDHLDVVHVNSEKNFSKRLLKEYSTRHPFLEYAVIFWWVYAFGENVAMPKWLRATFDSFVASERRLVAWL